MNFITKEGYSVINKILIITLILLIMGLYINSYFLIFLSTLSFILLLFCFFFFRNPERRIWGGKNYILAPADGTVMSIEDEYLNDLGKVKVIRIFLSIFNVHVQRAPVQGIISNIVYKKGKFLPAMHKRAHIENESNSVDFVMSDGKKIRCVQIAGIIARRIVLWNNNGKSINQGELYGMIKFGSQVDIYIPYDAEIIVHAKQKIQAGTTTIAKF